MDMDAHGPGGGSVSAATDPAGPSRTSWRVVNLVLLVLAVVLVAAAVFFWVDDADASPGDDRAETLSRQYKAVTAAAKDETLAFLTVDYRDMDALTAKVLSGATGPFKEQYAGARSNLKTSAARSQAVSSGKVLSVGISDVDKDKAVVFVAANSQVTNKSTKGKAVPRYYRLKLTMVREGDTWRTSDLQFVG
jgi:Mce-associated membrane protein